MWICGNAVLMARSTSRYVKRLHLRIDATLHADFGRAAVDRLLHLGEDHLDRRVVGVRFPALALERAELAADEADVREIDVAVHDVGHVVADVGVADRIGDGEEREEIVALGAEHAHAVVDVELAAREHALEQGAKSGRRGGETALERYAGHEALQGAPYA